MIGTDLLTEEEWQETKQRIYAKFRKQLEQGNPLHLDFCPELNPDVIVISSDHSLLFEPQNPFATQWLRKRCGSSIHDAAMRNKVRVHPCERERIIAELRAAGFVVC